MNTPPWLLLYLLLLLPVAHVVVRRQSPSALPACPVLGIASEVAVSRPAQAPAPPGAHGTDGERARRGGTAHDPAAPAGLTGYARSRGVGELAAGFAHSTPATLLTSHRRAPGGDRWRHAQLPPYHTACRRKTSRSTVSRERAGCSPSAPWQRGQWGFGHRLLLGVLACGLQDEVPGRAGVDSLRLFLELGDQLGVRRAGIRRDGLSCETQSLIALIGVSQSAGPVVRPPAWTRPLRAARYSQPPALPLRPTTRREARPSRRGRATLPAGSARPPARS